MRASAADFVSRLFQQFPTVSWDDLQKHLILQFSDLSDSLLARNHLSKIHQHKGETIASFGERILSAAAEAYFDAAERQSSAVENNLIDTFLKGLNSDHLARKLINKKVRHTRLIDIIPDAIAINRSDITYKLTRGSAADDSNSSNHFDREEPMDVSTLSRYKRASPSDKNAYSTMSISELQANQTEVMGAVGEIAQTQGHQSNVLNQIASRIENIQINNSSSSDEGSHNDNESQPSDYSSYSDSEDNEDTAIALLTGQSNKRFRPRGNSKFHNKETYRRLGQPYSKRSYSAPPQHNSTKTNHKHRSESPHTPRENRKRSNTRPFWKHKQSPPLKWDPVSGIPICAFCNLSGHIRSECRRRQNVKFQKSSSSNNQHNSSKNKSKSKPFL